MAFTKSMSRRAIRDMNGNSNRGADPLYGIHTDISDMETTQTRRLKHHLGHCLRAVMICFALGTSCLSGQVFAQPAETDARMVANTGEKAGELGRGELLANALKREKLDPNSIRQAMQSIGKLFDFRLSRAGDKYVYKAQNGRKILMLRYQRGPHVYEARWDEAEGEYTSRLVPKPANQPAAEQAAAPAVPSEEKVDFRAQLNEDEDGEVDVEHVTMRGQEQPREDIELAAPGDPILPEDEALAGKPSPDAEFEDRLEGDPLANAPLPNEDSEDSGEAQPQADSFPALPEDDEDDSRIANPVIPQPQAKNLIVPEPTVTNEPFTGSIRAKKPAETENTTFTTIGYVTLILGSVFLLLASLIYALPALRARRRANGMGLAIRDIIRISADQRLAFVECDGYTCLIAIHRDNASLVTPCPLDIDTFIQQVKAKTYWHQMSGKPLSDRQLAALIQSLAHPKNTRSATAQLTLNDDSEEDEPTEDEINEERHTPPSHAFSTDDVQEDDEWDEDDDEEYEDDDEYEDEDEEDDDEDKRA